MDRNVQLAENVRHRFCSPVAIWLADSDGKRSWVIGETVDVSVYGLGLVFPVHIQINTEVTVSLCGVELCGPANVRHSAPCPHGFKIGLQFKQTLFMQKVPRLDKILRGSFYKGRNATKHTAVSLIQRIRLRLSGMLISKTGPSH
jgi:hypothetical protein